MGQWVRQVLGALGLRREIIAIARPADLSVLADYQHKPGQWDIFYEGQCVGTYPSFDDAYAVAGREFAGKHTMILGARPGRASGGTFISNLDS